MEKKLFLAFSLSLLVLLAWSNFVSKPVNRQQVTVPIEQPRQSEPLAIQSSQNTEIQSQPESEFEFPVGKSKIIFIEPQGAIKKIIFDNYQSSEFLLQRSLLVGEKNWDFLRQDSDNKEVTYFYFRFLPVAREILHE